MRSALGKAHDGDTINVPPGTYRLRSQLFINPSVTLTGAGASRTILTARFRTRVIETTNASSTVTLERLAVTHRKAEAGGGILNVATLKLNHVAVNDNLAAGGPSENVSGGIANSGSLTITHSQISGNKTAPGTAQGRGAGIADAVNGGGSLKISSSSITGNVAQGPGFGGALFVQPIDSLDSPGISITTSTISNNKAVGADVAGGDLLPTGPQ